ncbi:hypothetical protein LTR91_021137 [Friedmanniomyces endolithicus]|uniref:Uncharacterized protein n=1 Tax=Friedmanniomyces endolithicus TaxID=329885 RepID=A0AAN6H8K9_9PEZI|nr:hypothetical protein LTR94_008508 [Friedmanniomyces endolithicus]KAK0808920.1 hypothetical protein LTR38_004396 [Friedmanniomyces endolithicus]KAK0809643.1 hypothetical protein LTR59_002504 [Friedmanniomyces endolithicus]KAK0819482.1 hypothetical protein LTR75_002004 [Friedmanniomyces endolithicus]KAK0862192.1 hypothetical protein LTS02_007322 [Friedmanniomyces endolithicus]
MPSHVVLLAGAPEATDLDWDETDLLASFNTPVKRFLGHQEATRTTAQYGPTTHSPPAAKWRAISMRNPAHDATVPAPAGLPQTQFRSLDHDDNAIASQERLDFLQHSLALLANLDSSQIAAPEDTTAFASTPSFATATTGISFLTTNDSFFYSATPPTKPASVQLKADITDLSRIPSADHITRIQPQTITLNLLAAIISISPPRTVNLRKRTGSMDILELLLGDESKAGFSITFWLTPVESQTKPHNQNQQDDLRTELGKLRAGDVVVVQNVALSAFKGCVYGQSLSRRFARNSTSVTVMSAEDVRVHGSVAMKGKFERVQRWADDFVGRKWTGPVVVGKVVAGVGGRRVGEETLPPDTPETTEYD